VNISEELAEEALVRLAEHAPPDVLIGRPLRAAGRPDSPVVTVATVLDDADGRHGAVWLVGSDAAARLTRLPDDPDQAELVTYAGGVEVAREVRAVAELIEGAPDLP
jgi:hypothetical protein